MKLLKSISLLLCAFMAMAVVTSCEETEDKDKTPQFTDYFKFNVKNVERVGSVLIIDFDLINKTNKDYQNITLKDGYGSGAQISHDNAGNQYSNNTHYYSINNGKYNWCADGISVLAKDTVKGKVKIKDFDKTSTATKFSLTLLGDAPELNLTNSVLQFNNMSITDKRPTSRAFQTNDRKLTYTLVSSEMDSNRNVWLTFNVKNATGRQLNNFALSGAYRGDYKDNMGGSYFDVSFGTSKSTITTWFSVNIPANATQQIVCKVTNVTLGATSISGYFGVASDSYYFEDDNVYFYNLPIN